MANVKVRWVGDRTFIGLDYANHAVLTSTVEDNVGIKPSELLLVSLAACSSVDVVGILEKQKIKLRKLEVIVTAESETDPPWTFTHFHLKYIISGKGLEARHAENAIRLSQDKYCSVAATVCGKATIDWDYLIEE